MLCPLGVFCGMGNGMDTNNYRELFLKTASANLAKLRQGVVSLREPLPQLPALEQMHIAAHSLKGEGFAMGFQQFAAYSTVLEQYLKRVKESNESVSEPIILLLSSATEKLSQSLEQIKSKHEELQLKFETDMLARQLGVAVPT